MKIAIVVGARPNFMKAVPIWNSLCKKMSKENLYFIHTGQHYSHNLSQVFIDDLKINFDDITFLEKYSKTTYPKSSTISGVSWIITNLSDLFVKEKIEKVIVFGDVNSTLAASLATVMNNKYLIHIESGLRSYDMKMPEERNRVLVDKMSDLLFTTELSAKENLKREGIIKNVYHFGNTMMDTLDNYMESIKKSTYYSSLSLNKMEYIIFTLHRQENVENKDILEKIISTVLILKKIRPEHPILFITHPRTSKKLTEFKINTGTLTLIKSQSYLQMLNLVYNCALLITDSGGLQEESSYMGVPCITVRRNTERPLTVTKGYNIVIPPTNDNFISDFLSNAISRYGKRKNDNTQLIEEMGGGNSSDKIVNLILEQY